MVGNLQLLLPKVVFINQSDFLSFGFRLDRGVCGIELHFTTGITRDICILLQNLIDHVGVDVFTHNDAASKTLSSNINNIEGFQRLEGVVHSLRGIGLGGLQDF